MSTAHISANSGDFARTVLMPGDPLRARHIAEAFLDAPTMVTNVRAMCGFTGRWNGTEVSVMPSGMGMPSASIYITELVRFFGVSRIIRVGTTGAYQRYLELRDIIAASEATTNSAIPELLGLTQPLRGSPSLLSAADDCAKAAGLTLHTGPVFTSELFYEPYQQGHESRAGDGVLCVEMETAALYGIAQAEGVEALTLATVTDHLVTGERLSAQDRQLRVDTMIELALNVAAR